MRRLLAVLGITLVVMSVAYVARPAGHIPPYDANLTRLAENQLEAYCTGLAFAKQTSPEVSAVNARECREARSQDQTVYVQQRVRVGPKFESYTVAKTIPALSTVPDLGRVTGYFCQALDDTFLVPYDFCVAIMQSRQYWPTYDGWIAWEWSEQWPYPDPDSEDWVEVGS